MHLATQLLQSRYEEIIVGKKNGVRLSHTAAPRLQQHTSGTSLLAVLVGNQKFNTYKRYPTTS
jgi:sensor histidine kinase regulating citrate/malate metabolism